MCRRTLLVCDEMLDDDICHVVAEGISVLVQTMDRAEDELVVSDGPVLTAQYLPTPQCMLHECSTSAPKRFLSAGPRTSKCYWSGSKVTGPHFNNCTMRERKRPIDLKQVNIMAHFVRGFSR